MSETTSELSAWAAKCRSAAEAENDPEATVAYQELAREFEALSSEFDGLVEAFEILQRGK